MKRMAWIAALATLAMVLSGCMEDGREPESWRLNQKSANAPEIPEKVRIGEDGLPVLSVYDVKEGALTEMDVERYVAGVVAGEMKNDWPEEALKAQAILARTFVMKFCADKNSRYEGADISTDVSEAQAYAPASVNGRVKEAVEETRGMVMAYGGEYPNAWFHAHSGGMTELPSVALEYRGGDPAYLKPTESVESEKAPDNAKAWTATFTTEQVAKACADAGWDVEALQARVDQLRESDKATVVGGVSTDGYTFDDSEAVQNGQFVGLALDDVNESDKTEARIDAWIASLPLE